MVPKVLSRGYSNNISGDFIYLQKVTLHNNLVNEISRFERKRQKEREERVVKVDQL